MEQWRKDVRKKPIIIDIDSLVPASFPADLVPLFHEEAGGYGYDGDLDYKSEIRKSQPM